MKLLMFDFECRGCGVIFEDLIPSTENTAKCPECGDLGNRLIASPRLDWRMGADPEFATMGDKWARMQKQRQKSENQSTGNLWMY